MAEARRKSPDTKSLEDLIEQLEGDYEKAENGAVTISVRETEEILESMKWVCEFLNERKLYHKVQQKKKKIVERLIKEQLSTEELAQIDREAKKAAEKEIN